MSFPPIPGPRITKEGNVLTPPWQSWFYQLINYITSAFTAPALSSTSTVSAATSVSAGTSVNAGTTVKTGAVLVSGLPPAPAAGTRYYVTDATVTTFASIVAGGGGNAVPVVSDGTNWRIG